MQLAVGQEKRWARGQDGRDSSLLPQEVRGVYKNSVRVIRQSWRIKFHTQATVSWRNWDRIFIGEAATSTE